MSFFLRSHFCNLWVVIENIKKWLQNTNRSFTDGVKLYSEVSEHEPLKMFYSKAPGSDANKAKLYEALKAIFYSLKNGQKLSKIEKVAVEQPIIHLPKVEEKKVVNEELVKACELAAKKAWMILQNEKVRLRQLVSVEPELNENSEVNVGLRSSLAFNILELDRQMREAYDTLDYVKEHGHLPEAKEAKPLPENPIELVYKELNVVKLLSKYKRKEQNPKMVALIQKHEQTLKQIKHGITQFTEEWNGGKWKYEG